MAKCDVLSCPKEASEVITKLALRLCDWHAYEHHHEVGWIGKTDEDDVKNTIPKIKDTNHETSVQIQEAQDNDENGSSSNGV